MRLKKISKIMINKKIAILGLGYVGLPLAIEFGKKFETFGFDENLVRIKQLKLKNDLNNELRKKDFEKSKFLNFTSNIKNLKNCDYYIVTVPTPIYKNKEPNMTSLKKVTETIGGLLSKGNIVIYESTVYPGTTEEICVPILSQKSKLVYNKDFYVGYSPERINPGDKKHTLVKIKKITSGSNNLALKEINYLYKKIITAGIYPVDNIKIAEAAKIIENTQRDLNVALINELSIIFGTLDINTKNVLDAASTKWNFLNFSPGLVGGHCIGVDPYYLTYKSIKAGYYPKVIISGRKINDKMSNYIVKEVLKIIRIKKKNLNNENILIMGLTFKENCNDIRNSKVFDIFKLLKNKKIKVSVYDPHLDRNITFRNSKIKLVNKIAKNKYTGMIVAVAHDEFKKIGVKNLRSLMKKNAFIYDVKSIFNSHEVEGQL